MEMIPVVVLMDMTLVPEADVLMEYVGLGSAIMPDEQSSVVSVPRTTSTGLGLGFPMKSYVGGTGW